MSDPGREEPRERRRGSTRIRKETLLYSRIVPIALVILVIALVATLVIVGLSVTGII